MRYFVIPTDFSKQLQVWFHQSKSQLKALLLYRTIYLKNKWFWSLHQNSDSPKFPGSCYWKRYILFFEMMFLLHYRFVFLHEGRNQQPYTWIKVFDSNFSQLIYCIKNRALPKQERCFLLTYLESQCKVSVFLQAEVLLQGLSQRFSPIQ